jgi:serine/threonine protein phosphatase PrpC
MTSLPPVEACRRLVERVLGNGARDNVSVIVILARKNG